jgi:hypothetical protein
MKPWQCLVVGLVTLTTAGCRVDPAIPILERQLRIKEDEIYRLRGTIEDLQDGAVVCDDRRAGGRSRSSPPIPTKTVPAVARTARQPTERSLRRSNCLRSRRARCPTR